MDANITFIDIERFIAMVKDHDEWFYKRNEDPNGKSAPSTKDAWRRYIKSPTKELVMINSRLNSKERYKTINIADFLIYVNLTKDHNRGKVLDDYQPDFISSDSKKVLLLFLLGRLVEGDRDKSALTVHKHDSNEADLYNYLSNLSGTKSKCFYYLPGRTVSLNQLKALAKERYSNSLTDVGIDKGINGLLKAGLIKRTTDEKLKISKDSNLFRLDFDSCYRFLQQIKDNRNL